MTNPKNVVCPTCGRRFATRAALMQHRNMVHGGQPPNGAGQPRRARARNGPNGNGGHGDMAMVPVPFQRHHGPDLQMLRHLQLTTAQADQMASMVRSTLAMLPVDERERLGQLASTPAGMAYLLTVCHPMSELLTQHTGIPDRTSFETLPVPALTETSTFLGAPSTIGTAQSWDMLVVNTNNVGPYRTIIVRAPSGTDFNQVWDPTIFDVTFVGDGKMEGSARGDFEALRVVQKGFSMKHNCDYNTMRGMKRAVHYPLTPKVATKDNSADTEPVRFASYGFPVTPAQMLQKNPSVTWKSVATEDGHYGLGGFVEPVHRFIPATSSENATSTATGGLTWVRNYVSSDGTLLMKWVNGDGETAVGVQPPNIGQWMQSFDTFDNTETTSVFYAGLAVGASMTYTSKVFYETVPKADSILSSLIQASPEEDTVALEAANAILQHLPMDLPGSYNGFIDILKKIGSVAGKVIGGIFRNRKRIGSALETVGGAVGSIAPGRVGAIARGAATAGGLMQSV